MDDKKRKQEEPPYEEELMKKIEASLSAQEEYAQRQFFMAKVMAGASILTLAVVLAVALVALPQILTIFSDVQIIMEDVNTITSDLADSNLGQIARNMDHLVTSSEQSVQEALKQINSIDIATLNQAIKNLSDVVSPLARFFGK